MDLVTAIAILVQQCNQLSNLVNQVQNQSYDMQTLINQENSVAAVNPQVHALTASASIVMQALNSQSVIVQQAIDRVAELSA